MSDCILLLLQKEARIKELEAKVTQLQNENKLADGSIPHSDYFVKSNRVGQVQFSISTYFQLTKYVKICLGLLQITRFHTNHDQ